jgi:hypothetical protein
MTSSINKFLLAVFAFVMPGCNIREKNIYIPYGFEGNVAIFYKTSNRNPTEEIFNYEIPETGILYAPTTLPEGDFHIHYYQHNGRNGYDTLQVEEPGIRLDTARSRIYFHRTLGFMRDNITPYQVSTFYVGKKKTKDVNDERFDFERKLEKLVFPD